MLRGVLIGRVAHVHKLFLWKTAERFWLLWSTGLNAGSLIWWAGVQMESLAAIFLASHFKANIGVVLSMDKNLGS